MGLYDAELVKITAALRARHTGSYKWFLQYSDADNTINRTQWVKAIDEIGLKTMVSTTKGGIFDKLNFNKSKVIYLLDVEGLFKAHARKKGSKVKST